MTAGAVDQNDVYTVLEGGIGKFCEFKHLPYKSKTWAGELQSNNLILLKKLLVPLTFQHPLSSFVHRERGIKSKYPFQITTPHHKVTIPTPFLGLSFSSLTIRLDIHYSRIKSHLQIYQIYKL